MHPELLIPLYCGLIVVASLFGGWLPSIVRLTHTRMQVLISLVAGFMLGVGLLHMVPHAIAQGVSGDQVSLWLLAGLLVMFFLVRTLHFHDHTQTEGECDATREHAAGHSHASPPRHRLSWIGVAVGLGLHSAIDGVAVAAAVMAAGGGVLLGGLGTLLAVLLHKPLDALAVTSLMAAGGWSKRARTLVNAGFALTCPLGAALFYFGWGHGPGAIVGCALAFSAGVFLCIALGDLLPEIQFHSHDRLKLSAALLLGVALAYAIKFVEPGHLHEAGAGAEGHDHAAHSHE